MKKIPCKITTILKYDNKIYSVENGSRKYGRTWFGLHQIDFQGLCVLTFMMQYFWSYVGEILFILRLYPQLSSQVETK